MQWDDLRVFLAVAQGGSLRKATRALRLGQPTIGRHLHQLELSVGARLFERSANGHRLTREGKKLLPMAQSMADAAAAIDRRRAALGSDVRSAVRIVAGEWAARFLAPRLSALADPDGDLSVSLTESHLDPDLDRCEADLFVRDGLPARGETVANEKIGLAPIEIGVEMTFGERDGEIAVRVGQRRQTRREESRGPFARHDADRAPDVAAESGAAPIDCRRGLRHALRHRQELLAFARQAMPIRRALEQPGAHAQLELVEVPSDGRLSESQRTRRLAQAAALGDGEENPQIIPLHAPSLANARKRKGVLRIRNAAFHIWRLVRPRRRWFTGGSWEGARWARTGRRLRHDPGARHRPAGVGSPRAPAGRAGRSAVLHSPPRTPRSRAASVSRRPAALARGDGRMVAVHSCEL